MPEGPGPSYGKPMLLRLSTLLLVLIACLAPSESWAAGGKPQKTSKPAKVAPAKSVGSPNEGRLIGGKKLERSKTVRPVGGHRWGLPSLVGMIERSAAAVAKRFPGAVLTVGDLSRKGGGDVDGHRSHESGRDVDVAFYYTRGSKAYVPPRFAAVEPDGRVRGYPAVRFDDARNWSLIEAWLTDPGATVLQIFVAQHLKLRLLEAGRRAGASPRVLGRAAGLLVQPKRALPHDNHFHVRIACPKTHADCKNFGTRERKPARVVARPATRPAPRAAKARIASSL